MSVPLEEESCVVNVCNGLLLYYYQYSYYSQKVLMALYEKNLNFDRCVVDISKGEQYQPWFLQLNPRGEVPVLQDTVKIIPESGRIIDYLEDNFSNGSTPRLIPLDQEIKKKVLHFRNIIEALPVGVITVGSFFHPEFVRSPKAPFFSSVRSILKDAENNRAATLKKHAELNPQAEQALLSKLQSQDDRHGLILNLEAYAKILGDVNEVLNEIEDELSTHIGERLNWWLCTENFTVADVELTILLDRLHRLGFSSKFWAKGVRPGVDIYYLRVKNRDSFKKTVPSTLCHLKLLYKMRKNFFIGFGLLTAVTFVLGGLFAVKRALK